MANQKSNVATYGQRTSDMNSQIAAIKAGADRDVRELEKRITAVNTTSERSIVALRAAADQLNDELATEIALEFHGAAAPLIEQWSKQPTRTIAGALADVYRAADKRARDEVGEDLWEGAIGVAVASALIATNPAAANVFGSDDGRIVAACHSWVASLDQGPGNVERQLAELEAGLQALAAAETGTVLKRNVDRFEVKRSIATHRYMSKLHAFDAQAQQKHEAELAASYVPLEPREPFRERARKVLGALGI